MLTQLKEEQSGYIQLIRSTLKSQTAYLQSLETSDMFAPSETTEGGQGNEDDGNKKRKGAKKSSKKDKAHPAQNPQSKALKGNIEALLGLHGKLHGDLSFAKRETAWGKLNAKDIDGKA